MKQVIYYKWTINIQKLKIPNGWRQTSYSSYINAQAQDTDIYSAIKDSSYTCSPMIQIKGLVVDATHKGRAV